MTTTAPTTSATRPRTRAGSGTAHLLVSTTERDRAVELLKEFYANGTLDHSEFDLRVEQALEARTRNDLNGVFHDLRIPPRTSTAMQTTAGHSLPAHYGDDRIRGGLTQWLGYPTSFVGPLVVANTAGKRSPQLRARAIEAANFQLTVLLAVVAVGMVADGILGFVGILMPVLFMAWLVLTGLGGLATMVGGKFRYPFTLRLLK